MAAFHKWVKKYFDDIVDPTKNNEIDDLTKILHDAICTLKKSFVLAQVLANRPFKERHLDQAKIRTFQIFLDRAWDDGRVNSGEREALGWVAQCLELPNATVRSMSLESALPKFARAFSAAMDNGKITPEEAAVLDEIARAAGLSLREFVKKFFRSDGENFLRGIFAAGIADDLSPFKLLEHLMTPAALLGFNRSDVQRAIQPQAVRYIEHVLADAKEDDVLSGEEEATLFQLLESFALSDDVRDYVTRELRELRSVSDVRRGKLPSISAPQGVSVKSGELIHYHGKAVWQSLRLLRSGEVNVNHEGHLTITDSRMIFTSPTRSESFKFGRIISHELDRWVIKLQIQGKPTQWFVFEERSRIPAEIFGSALRMANQVLISEDKTRQSRHIPRDVRQRVWQKYGGQCADCSSTSYLEFDHIVPFAKGGSNSDANVQLLCRGCNSKKSDMI